MLHGIAIELITFVQFDDDATTHDTQITNNMYALIMCKHQN